MKSLLRPPLPLGLLLLAACGAMLERSFKKSVEGVERTRAKPAPDCSPWQATGAPNVTDARAIDPLAWAPKDPDAGAEWLEVEFGEWVKATSIRIHETGATGGVVAIDGVDWYGAPLALWRGVDSTHEPGVFEVALDGARTVRRARIRFDTARHRGFEQIDAVEVWGLGGPAWARSATASSYRGQK